jgi:hypothetical protein
MEVSFQLHALGALPPGEIVLGLLQGRSGRVRIFFSTRKSEKYLLFQNSSYQKISALFDVSQVSAASSTDKCNVKIKMIKERCWNVTSRGRIKVL